MHYRVNAAWALHKWGKHTNTLLCSQGWSVFGELRMKHGDTQSGLFVSEHEVREVAHTVRTVPQTGWVTSCSSECLHDSYGHAGTVVRHSSFHDVITLAGDDVTAVHTCGLPTLTCDTPNRLPKKKEAPTELFADPNRTTHSEITAELWLNLSYSGFF